MLNVRVTDVGHTQGGLRELRRQEQALLQSLRIVCSEKAKGRRSELPYASHHENSLTCKHSRKHSRTSSGETVHEKKVTNSHD